MRRMKPETKRLVTGIIAIFLALIMVLGMVLPFVVQGAELAPPSGVASSALSIEGSIGFGANSLYKVGAPMPVSMFITNNGTGFDGEVRIRVNLSADTDNPAYAEHSYPLSLPQGGSRKLSMTIAIPTIAKGVLAEIADAKGNILASKLFPLVAISEWSPLAGVFSDSQDNLAYLRLLSFYNGNNGQNEPLGSSLLPLDHMTIPDAPDMLNAYNLLIINDYDTRDLSPAQVELLSVWVQSGGTLLLGTGRAFDKVTDGLAALGLDLQSDGAKQMANLSMADGAISMPFFEGETYHAAALPKGGTTLAVGDGKQPVIKQYPVGAGHILLCAFDLGLLPLPESPELTALLQSVLEQAVSMDSVRSDANMLSEYTSSLDSLPNMSSGMLVVIYIFLAAYIIFLGPVLYLVLKKKDKRDAGWFVVPIIAVASTLLVYLFSLNTAYRRPYVNAFATLRLTNGSAVANATHLFSAYTAAKGDVEISFGEPIPLAMPSNTYNYQLYYSGFSGRSPYGAVDRKTSNVTKLTHGDTPSIRYYSRMAWQQSTALAERTVTLAGGLDVDLSVVSTATGMGFTGYITNNTGLTLEDVTVFLPIAGYYSLGRLAHGETATVAAEDIIASSNFRYGGNATLSNLASELFEPYYYRYMSTDLTNEELRVLSLKYNLIASANSEMYDRYMPYSAVRPVTTTGTGMTIVYNTSGQMTIGGNNAKGFSSNQSTGMDITVFAFTQDRVYDGDIRINKQSARRFDLNLLMMTVETPFVSGSELMLPFGFVGLSEVATTTYADVYDTEIYLNEPGDVEFTFTMPDILAAEWLWFDTADIQRNAARMLIWNAAEAEWQPMTDISYDAAMYLDENGCARIRAEQMGGYYSVLPTISVSGIVK